ncbi:MAG: phosphoribosylformylglycinamidine synthase, partial [Clostridiales bacterium]|nr:phosphoribosylformylglycinamidine synthase [Clostridiales bacterium]
MSTVRRVYVEKKQGFDIEKKHLLEDIKRQLHIDELEDIRLINRYDAQGLTQEQFKQAIINVFSEPPMDIVYEEELPEIEGELFAVEYLPGQYDQRADSAAQCIEFLTQTKRPKIRCARVYIINKGLTTIQISQIKEYIINPVDSHEAQIEKYQTLEFAIHQPSEVEVLDGFIKMPDDDVEALCTSMGLAMSQEDIKFVRDYFSSQKRNPTITEIRVIDTYWSDHCRHTTFLTHLGKIEIEDSKILARAKQALKDYHEAREFVYGAKKQNRPVTLMDIATMGVRLIKKRGYLEDLDASEEVNACSIKIDV